MDNHRRTILHLVAIGRLTPAEAERLLIAWNDGRESIWALSACIAITLLVQLNPRQWMPSLVSSAHLLIPGIQASLHSVLSLVNHLLGGIV
jgi:hypothetical protein